MTVSPDSQQFLFAELVEEAEERSISVVLNWFGEFRHREQN